MIGLFGIGEILLTLEEGLAFKGQSAKLNLKVVMETWRELPRYWMTSLRSSAVGCFMGIVPGGATPASFMAYGVAKRFSKDGEKFGTGQVEGVVAPGDRRARRRHERVAADAHARRPRLADRGGAARRVADLGPAAWPAALPGAEGVRLGPDREHVSRATSPG